MRAAGYLRVSTEGQVGSDRYGLDSQRSNIETFAAANGHEIVAWYTDAGTSGGSMDRPELQRVLHDSALRGFEICVVAKLDRLSRDLGDQLWLEKELMKKGVEVVSATEPFNGQNAIDRMVRHILGAVAQQEKSRIKERLSNGRKAKARQSGYAGGAAPFGYRAIRGQKALVVDPQKAVVVRRVFALHSEKSSLQAIADRLNVEGYTTAHGATWRKTQVARVLSRELVYRGGYQYSDVTVGYGRQSPILS
jgi:DNA invertase Pin-like site-specific DNA recombinase